MATHADRVTAFWAIIFSTIGLQACGGGADAAQGDLGALPVTPVVTTTTPIAATAAYPEKALAYRLSDPADAAKPDYVKAMATLPNGNVAVALIQSDTIVVDDAGHSLRGAGSDAGVVVYDQTTGEATARFSFGGNALRVVPHGIAADRDGNVVVIGYAASNGGASSVDFGAGPVGFVGGEVPFVAKFSSAGVLQWAHVLQGSAGNRPSGCAGTNCDRAWDVAVASSGAVGVIGGFSGELVTPNGTKLQSVGGTDVFVLTLDASGIQQAAWAIGGPGDEGGFPGTAASPGGLGEMALVFHAGDWVVQGTFGPSTEFRGMGASWVRSPANGVRDVFVARYSTAGALLGEPWVAGAISDVSGGLSAPGAMRADAAGNLYLSLRFNPGAGGTGPCATQAGERLYTLSLTPDFGCRWLRRFDFSPGGIHRTVCDGAGHVYVAGWFQGSHAFTNQTVSARSTRSDMFLAQLDTQTGVARWGAGMVTSSPVAAGNIPAGLALDGFGNPWVGGQMFAATEFAQTAMGQQSKVLNVSYGGAIAANSNDGFVARYDRDSGKLR